SRPVSTVRIVLFAALGLLVLSGVAFAISELLHRDVSSRSVVVNPVRKIVVHSDSGDVDIRAGLTGNVVVQRHDQWLLDRPTVHETYADGVLTIDTGCGSLKAVLRCRADLMIDAPPEVDVQVKT